MYPNLDRHEVVSIDVETTGVEWYRDKVFGVAVSTFDGSEIRDYYFDSRVDEGLFAWLRDQAPKIDKVVNHNVKFDIHMLLNEGIVVDPRRVECTMINAALINEHLFKYDLDSLAQKYIGRRKDSAMYEKLAGLFGGQPTRAAQMKNISRAPKSVVEEYAKTDSRVAMELWMWQQKEIKRQGLQQVHELEMRLFPHIFDMERRGIRVDTNLAHETMDKLSVEINQIQKELNAVAGFHVNPNPSGSIKKLFSPKKNADGIWIACDGTPLPATSGDQPSIGAEQLLAMTHPAAKLILKCRKYMKTRDTFLAKHVIEHAHNGRVHPNINQTKSDSGGGVEGTGCMTSDTLVMTQRGWLKVVDVVVGDLVFDHEGRPQRVIDWFENGVHPIYKVTTRRGHSIKVTGNHPFLVGNNWVRADELKVGDRLLVYGHPEQWRPVEGWPYEVSSWGRVRSTGKGGVSTLRVKNPGGARKVYGYLVASLKRGDQVRINGNKSDFTVHRLVADAWGMKGGVTQHLNGFPWDNNIQNLMRSSQKENNKTGASHGSYAHSQKLTPGQVEEIKSLKGKGLYQREVAERYKVSREMIRNMWNGLRWKDHEVIEKKLEYSEDEVLKIEIMPPEETFGIEVENTHSHLTAGIVTHNTGRLSYSNPALQQIPSRDKAIAAMVRPIFLPDEGSVWGYGDLDQHEFRIFAHYVNAPSLNRAYQENPDLDIHQIVADMTGMPRNATRSGQANAKQINLAMVFNMGGGKLAEKMGLPFTVEKMRFKDEDEEREILKPGEETLAVMARYYEAVPGVKEMAKNASTVAKSRGFVRTMKGRHIRFPGGKFTHKASGLIYQGTSADLNKENICRICEYLAAESRGRLLLSIHDEYSISLPCDNAKKHLERIKYLIEDRPELRVPLRIDFSIPSENWWEATQAEKITGKGWSHAKGYLTTMGHICYKEGS